MLYQIGKNEGVFKGLWRGVGPNVARATVTTAAQVTMFSRTDTSLTLVCAIVVLYHHVFIVISMKDHIEQTIYTS